MNIPLISFLVSFLVIMLLLGYFLRGALFSITTVAAQHAKTYAVAYVKGGCLIFIAMGTAFKETFQPLTVEVAARLAWWDWTIKFTAPLLAGLAVLAAFLDRSIQNATPHQDNPPAPPVSLLPPKPSDSKPPV